MSGGNAGNGWARRTIANVSASSAGVARRSREPARQHLAAAAETETQARRALLAGGFRSRRILLETLQMRRDELVVGSDRGSARACTDCGRRLRLPFGPGGRGGARRRRGLRRLLGFLANRLRFLRHRLRRFRDDLGRLGFRRRRIRSSVPAAPRLRVSVAAGSLRVAPAPSRASPAPTAARRRPPASPAPARCPSASAAATPSPEPCPP